MGGGLQSTVTKIAARLEHGVPGASSYCKRLLISDLSLRVNFCCNLQFASLLLNDRKKERNPRNEKSSRCFRKLFLVAEREGL